MQGRREYRPHEPIPAMRDTLMVSSGVPPFMPVTLVNGGAGVRWRAGRQRAGRAADVNGDRRRKNPCAPDTPQQETAVGSRLHCFRGGARTAHKPPDKHVQSDRRWIVDRRFGMQTVMCAGLVS